MDLPDFPSGRSPRQELQLHGPRPSRLKVHKDSHKIRKQPVAPPPAAAEGQSNHRPPPPVIIYTVSPKIIHVNPDEFKSLVQSLTGPNSSSSTLNVSQPSSSASTSFVYAFQESGGGMSLAPVHYTSGQFPGILSPNPSTLSNPDLHSNMNENSSVMPSLSLPHMTNTPSSNSVDIFGTLFDL